VIDQKDSDRGQIRGALPPEPSRVDLNELDDAALLARIRACSETARKVWSSADERSRLLDELDRMQAELTRRMLAAERTLPQLALGDFAARVMSGEAHVVTGPLSLITEAVTAGGRHRNTDDEGTEVLSPLSMRLVGDSSDIAPYVPIAHPARLAAAQRRVLGEAPASDKTVPSGHLTDADYSRFETAMKAETGWRRWLYRRMTLPRVAVAASALGSLVTLGVQLLAQVIA
jgi:hypothetical protein